MRDITFSRFILFSTAAASGSGKSLRIPLPLIEPPPNPDPKKDPYRGVILVLLLAAVAGMISVAAVSWRIADLVLVDTVVMLMLASGILIGVLAAMAARSQPPERDEASPDPLSEGEPQTASHDRFARARAWINGTAGELSTVSKVRVGTAVVAGAAIFFVTLLEPTRTPAPGLEFAIIAAIWLAFAGLAFTAARYLTVIDTAALPESPGLCRGARVLAWTFVAAAASMGLVWAGQLTILRTLQFAIAIVVAAACWSLLTVRHPESRALEIFPLDLPVLRILGSRTNIFASVLDAAEQQLGIDLRSTWALAVVRRSLEPLAISLALVGWLSTSLTVVGLEEQGLVERFGVPRGGQPLAPGIHVHWPFPLDRVLRLPVQRIQTTTVGHEGEEKGGPEDVLWARQHAANEYTLLLGNGRDLITIDAALEYRIRDPRAWRYNCQNPADALRAIAYRAVMRSTVNRTLSDALSENVVALTGRMRQMVQQDADALGLGVEVVAFTLGGMHPPVPVAAEYQSVVSAEIAKTTAIVNAQAFRNQTVPIAESTVIMHENTAQADGAEELAKAAGEAWSFRTLESQYRTDPQEYRFRRRLEALEKNLLGRRFTVLDFRFQRDGGELWLNP